MGLMAARPKGPSVDEWPSVYEGPLGYEAYSAHMTHTAHTGRAMGIIVATAGGSWDPNSMIRGIVRFVNTDLLPELKDNSKRLSRARLCN